MLVLTRRRGQAFLINNDITIRVLDVQGGKIQIGIEAPSEAKILREELYVRNNQKGRRTLKLKRGDKNGN